MADPTDWCFPSGIVAVLETFLLTPRAVAELAASGDPDELLSRVRRSSVYASLHLSGSEDPMRIAAALEAALVEYVRGLVTQCPDERAADVFLIEYDLRDVANLLKSRFCGIERRPVPLSAVPEDAADEFITETPRLAAVAADVTSTHEATGSIAPATVDLMIDAAFIALLPELTAPLGAPLIDAWARQRQRFALLEAVVRAKAAGLEPEEVHRTLLGQLPADAGVTALADAPPDNVRRALADLLPAELAEGYDPQAGAAALQTLAAQFDAALERTLEPARYVAFGPERVFGFLWQLLRENRNLRAALGGFAGRIEPALVSESLRGVHG